ncbi:hypothetical protein ACJBU6_00947 [Exserohilum turcicum]
MSSERHPSIDSPNGAPQPSSHASRPSAGGAPTPAPRSCVTCRRRKVKCDKNNPCSNCVRAKIECIFPGPGRAPRKSRKPSDAELLERLRRLEGVVISLNAQVEGHEHDAADRDKQRQSSAGLDNRLYHKTAAGPTAQDGDHGAINDNVDGLESRFGRLVIEKGRSRYINNSFWASLNNEVEDLKTILIEPSEDEDDAHSPESINTSLHYPGFIFGFSSSSVDIQALHPPEHQARRLWDVFKDNVESLVKVLHVPSMEPTILSAFANIDKVAKGLETLLFAIYYGAVTSTPNEDCLQQWGEERSVLLSRYRFGLEQALARANFLYCDEMIILQAFAIFLVVLRRNDDARKIWTMMGLVVRMAQALGIHRDGTYFGLSPFETEMRRRLWWQVCILDARSSEDHGCDPTIAEALFDTKMPLNINDADINPDMTEFPPERQGFTDMTFCLLRFEITDMMRRITYAPTAVNKCNEHFAHLSIKEKEEWITECHQALEVKYLKDCDMTMPMCWVSATVARLIVSKVWLIIYHPHQRKDGGATLPQETRDKLFITSLESLEYGVLLETEARTMKWGWLFRTYVQWHAIAFLLSELCVRTKGEAVERAWRALEASASRWFPFTQSSSHRKDSMGNIGTLWRPLGKLLEKAKAARERELVLERASIALRSGPYPANAFAFEHYKHMQQQSKIPLMASNQQTMQAVDGMLQGPVPKVGDLPSSRLPGWPNSPGQSQWGKVSMQSTWGLQMQHSLPNGAVSGVPNGSGEVDSQGQDFGRLLEYQRLDDVLGHVMEDGSLSFEDETKATRCATNVSPTMTSPTCGHMPTTQVLAPNNASTAAGGYPPFDETAFVNTNMDWGICTDGAQGMASPNGKAQDGGGGNEVMENGEMDWTLWDDMVNQFGIEGNAANPGSSGGPGPLGMVHWL